MEVFNAQMMILLNINHVISNYVQVTIKPVHASLVDVFIVLVEKR